MNFAVIDLIGRVMGEVDLGGTLWRQVLGTNRFDSINDIEVEITHAGAVAGAEIRSGNQVIRGPLNCAGSHLECGSVLRMRPGDLNLSFHERFEFERMMPPPMPSEEVLVNRVMDRVSASTPLREVVRTAIQMTREALSADA